MMDDHTKPDTENKIGFCNSCRGYHRLHEARISHEGIRVMTRICADCLLPELIDRIESLEKESHEHKD